MDFPIKSFLSRTVRDRSVKESANNESKAQSLGTTQLLLPRSTLVKRDWLKEAFACAAAT